LGRLKEDVAQVAGSSAEMAAAIGALQVWLGNVRLVPYVEAAFFCM
jgi:hypothetical protein